MIEDIYTVAVVLGILFVFGAWSFKEMVWNNYKASPYKSFKEWLKH